MVIQTWIKKSHLAKLQRRLDVLDRERAILQTSSPDLHAEQRLFRVNDRRAELVRRISQI